MKEPLVHLQLPYFTQRDFNTKRSEQGEIVSPAPPKGFNLGFLRELLEEVGKFAKIFPLCFPIDGSDPLVSNQQEAIVHNIKGIKEADLVIVFYANGDKSESRAYGILTRAAFKKPLLILSQQITAFTDSVAGAIEMSKDTIKVKSDIKSFIGQEAARQVAKVIQTSIEEFTASGKIKLTPNLHVLDPPRKKIATR